ncbi:MAG: hypothetical protein ACO1ON_13100 [Nocardioides sp.]
MEALALALAFGALGCSGVSVYYARRVAAAERRLRAAAADRRVVDFLAGVRASRPDVRNWPEGAP